MCVITRIKPDNDLGGVGKADPAYLAIPAGRHILLCSAIRYAPVFVNFFSLLWVGMALATNPTTSITMAAKTAYQG
jgi:hypothetical protein